MAGYQNGKFPEREKNVADDPRLRLWGERKQGETRSSSFSFAFFNGSPRFYIYPAQEGAKRLEFKLDTRQLFEVLETIRELARSNEKRQAQWNLNGFIAQGKKGVVGTLIAGRSEDGVVYVGGTTYGWDKPLLFKFRADIILQRVDRDGNPIPESEVSGTIAVAYTRLIESIVGDLHPRQYKHPEPKQRNGNSGGNNNGGYNNNSSAPAASQAFDDDIFF